MRLTQCVRPASPLHRRRCRPRFWVADRFIVLALSSNVAEIILEVRKWLNWSATSPIPEMPKS